MGNKFNYSPCLFCTDEGKGFTFVIKPCEEKEELRALVEYGGGDVVSTPCDTGVIFIPPNVEFCGDDEVYSTAYIRDCCEQNSILDLRPYRLNKRSIVPEEVDVREILCKRRTWSDVFGNAPKTTNSSKSEQQHEDTRDKSVFKKPFPKVPVHNEESDNSSDGTEFIYVTSEDLSEDEDSETEETTTSDVGTKEGDDAFLNEPSIKHVEENSTKRARLDETCMTENNHQKGDTSGSEGSLKADCSKEENVLDESEQLVEFYQSFNSKRKPPHKRLYTEAERQAILNFIVSRKLGSYTKGNDIWKKMEVKKVCPGRSWQSLKEHFRKYILENIDKYDIPEEVVRQLKA